MRPPGVHRPASPTARQADAAPAALRGLGRAPRPAGDAAPESSGGGRQLRTTPAGLPGLSQRSEQASALQRLLKAQQPPGPLAEALHLLADRLDDLSQAARQQASTQVLEWAERLEPGPARELARHLPALPDAAQAPALSGLLRACSTKAPGQRTDRLEDLARGSVGLSGPVLVQALRGVLGAAESLAPHLRWAVLKPLCEQVYRLPKADQASTWQAVVHSHLAVPPGQLAAALTQLHARIRTLLQAGVERQLAVPLTPAVLQELPAWPQLGTLPPAERKQALLLCAQVLDELPQADPQGFLAQEAHRDPSSSRQQRLRTEPADRLTSLPHALHEKIAVGMGPKYRAMLACSNRALHDSLQGYSTSDKVVVQGKGVECMEQLRAALQNVESLPLEQTDLRARSLAVLAGRIWALREGEDRLGAFDAVLTTLLKTPAGGRRPMDGPLMMLAAQVIHLGTDEQQAGALQRLLQAQEPARSLAGGLHLLAGRLEDLPQAARPQASTQVLECARRLEPGPARELACILPYLPDAALEPVLSGLLQGCSSVEPGQRTETLKALASIGNDLDAPPLHLQAVQGSLAAAGPLAPEQRWAVLKPLCRDLYLLPQAEHASIWQEVVHSYLAVPPGQLDAAIKQLDDQMQSLGNKAPAGQQLALHLTPAVVRGYLAWVKRGESLLETPGEALPPQVQSVMLGSCAKGMAYLPGAERQPFFQLALRSMPLLRHEDHRPLLEALADAIGALPEAARQLQWQNTLQAVDQLPPEQSLSVLDRVSTQIHTLPLEARVAAFESLQQALRGLDGQDSGSSVRIMGNACTALPRARWEPVLNGLLKESEQIPDLERRARAQVSLAEQFCRAKPAVAAPGNPRNDDRLRRLLQVVSQILRLSLGPDKLKSHLNSMRSKVEMELRIRPHDAGFLVAALDHLSRAVDRVSAAGAADRWRA